MKQDIFRSIARGVGAGVATGNGMRRFAVGAALSCLAVATIPAPAPAQTCVGDCDGNGAVSIGELITMVNIALGNVPVSACQAGDVNGDATVTVNEIIQAVRSALEGCDAVATATPSATVAETGSPTDTATATPTATLTSTAPLEPTATATATSTPTSTFTPTATSTFTPTATSTFTPTATPSSTPTASPTFTETFPPGQIAPPDASFNDPLDIPLDSNASVTDFVSFPGGDTTDQVRWDILGMNPNSVLPGGRARLVIAVSCFGTGTDQIEFFTGGQTFACGQTIVDREVTADSRTGQVTITAVGGVGTYVQWVLTGTATRTI